MFKIFWASLYIGTVFLVRLLPRYVAIECGQMVSFLYYLLGSKGRFALRDNLKHILKSKFKESYVRQVYGNFAFYLVDFMRVKNDNRSFFENFITIENQDAIDKAFEASNGGIVGLSMHLGNWEFAGGHFAYLGYPVSAVALNHAVGFVDRFFKLQRKRLGIEGLPFKDSFNICQEKLKQGKLLGLLCDRDFTGNFISSALFGKKYYLPKAPFLMSLRMKSPLFLAVTVRTGYKYKTIVKGPFLYKSFNLKEMYSMVNRIVSIMEDLIKEYPQQWFFFQKFWEKPQDVVIL